MKKYIFILTALLGLTFTASVFAADIKIGFVDIEKVMQILQIKTAYLKLEKQFLPVAEAIKAKAKTVQQHALAFERDFPVMSATEKSGEQKKLKQEVQALQKQRAKFTQDIQNAKAKMTQKITSKIKIATASVAEKGHYEIVLPKSAMIYYKDIDDITEQVVQALNSQ